MTKPITLSQVMGIIEIAMEEFGYDAKFSEIDVDKWTDITKEYLASQIAVEFINNSPNIYGPLGAVFSKS